MNWKLIALLSQRKINEVLLLKIEYLLEENKIYRKQINKQVKLTKNEKLKLSFISRKLGKKYFEDVCTIFKPKTVLDWYKKILRKAHTYPHKNKKLGRPSTLPQIEQKLVKIASENRLWGYGKLKGSLKNIGHHVSLSTIKRILRKHDLSPVKDKCKSSSWHQFIQSNQDVLWASDFFNVDVLDVFHGFKVKTYYVLFFIHIGSRKVHLGGITQNPNDFWIKQTARNITMDEDGFLKDCKYLIHDRATQYSSTGFQTMMESVGIKTIKTSVRSPDLNSYAERWVKSIREECLDHLLLFREKSLYYAINKYIEFYNFRRNHQSMGNEVLDEQMKLNINNAKGKVKKKSSLGGLLNFYYRDSA